jgi:hypothetical protein
VPVVTVIVDTPEHIGRWFAVVDGLTDETGLVTSEQVPAVRASGPGIARVGAAPRRPGSTLNPWRTSTRTPTPITTTALRPTPTAAGW